MNEKYMRINQQRWDEMVGVHEKSAFYDVAGFKAGRNSLAPLEREELGNALLSEGLSIDFFHEFPFCGWQYFSDMETGEDGWSRLRDEKMRKRVPMMFSLKATKK